jgi:alpha-1,2-mannosyltransferase
VDSTAGAETEEVREIADFQAAVRGCQLVLSLAQFRPEKDHKLQIDSFARLLFLGQLPRWKQWKLRTHGREMDPGGEDGCSWSGGAALRSEKGAFDDVCLVIAGSTRNEDDVALVEILKSYVRNYDFDALWDEQMEWNDHHETDNVDKEEKEELASTLGRVLRKRVHFVVNVSLSRLQSLCARASVGLHSMWCEHFGIGVVEMMAAGLVVVAHDSGGPRMDIVRPALRADPQMPPSPPLLEADGQGEMDGCSTGGETAQHCGYLASSASDYASCLASALSLPPARRVSARHRARQRALDHFGDAQFEQGVLEMLDPWLAVRGFTLGRTAAPSSSGQDIAGNKGSKAD